MILFKQYWVLNFAFLLLGYLISKQVCVELKCRKNCRKLSRTCGWSHDMPQKSAFSFYKKKLDKEKRAGREEEMRCFTSVEDLERPNTVYSKPWCMFLTCPGLPSVMMISAWGVCVGGVSLHYYFSQSLKGGQWEHFQAENLWRLTYQLVYHLIYTQKAQFFLNICNSCCQFKPKSASYFMHKSHWQIASCFCLSFYFGKRL